MRLILMGILLVLGISSSRAQNPYTLLSKGEKFQLEDNNYILEGSFYLLSISKELKDNYWDRVT